jgi:hypothetical protein
VAINIGGHGRVMVAAGRGGEHRVKLTVMPEGERGEDNIKERVERDDTKKRKRKRETGKNLRDTTK